MTVTTEPTATRKEVTVEQWEAEQMEALGVPAGDAILLARAHVEWHAVKALIDGGCPVELVRGILA